MTLKPVSLIAVGRLKTPFWKEAAAHYAMRLQRWRNLREICIKDGDAALSPEERSAQEGRRILDALKPSFIAVALDERGDSRTSIKFCNFLQEISSNAQRIPCFIIGGPFGLSEEVRQACRYLVSFGPMTLPHEMARVLLLEQLYRAEAIQRNVPYHHQ